MMRPSPSIEVVDLTGDDDESAHCSGAGTGSGIASLASNPRCSPDKPASLVPIEPLAVASSTTRKTTPAGGSNSQHRELPHTNAFAFVNTQRSDGSPFAANDGPPSKSRRPLPPDAPSSGTFVAEPSITNPHRKENQNPLSTENGNNLQTNFEELAEDTNTKRPVNIVSKPIEAVADTQKSTERAINTVEKQQRPIEAASRPSFDFAIEGQAELGFGYVTSRSPFPPKGTTTERKVQTVSAPLVPIDTVIPDPHTRQIESPSVTTRKRKKSWPRPPSEAPVFSASPNIKWLEPVGTGLAKPSVSRPSPKLLPPLGTFQSPKTGFQSPPEAMLPNTASNKTPKLVSYSPPKAASFSQNTAAISQPPVLLASWHDSLSTSKAAVQEASAPHAETGAERAAPRGEPSMKSESHAMHTFPPNFDRGRFPHERRRRGAKGAPNPWISKGHHNKPYSTSSTSNSLVDVSMPSSTPVAVASSYREKEPPKRLSLNTASLKKPSRIATFAPTFGSPAQGGEQSSNAMSSSTEFTSKTQNQSTLAKFQDAKTPEDSAKEKERDKDDVDVVFDYFGSPRTTGWHHDGYADVKKLFEKVASDAVRVEKSHYKNWPIDLELATEKVVKKATDWASKRFGDFVNRLSVSPTSIPNSKDVRWLQRKVAQTFLEVASFAKTNASVQTIVFGPSRDESCILSDDEDSHSSGPLIPLNSTSTSSAHTSPPAERPDPPFKSHKRISSAMSYRRPARSAAFTAASRISSQYQTEPIAQDHGVHVPVVTYPKRLCPDCDCLISVVNTKVHLATKKHKQNARRTGGRREEWTKDQNVQQKAWRSRLPTPAFASEVEPNQSRFFTKDGNSVAPSIVTLQTRRKVVQGAYHISLAASFAAGDSQMPMPSQGSKARGIIDIVDSVNLLEQSQLLRHVDQQAKSMFTLTESCVKDPNFRPTRCVGSLLRHRELGSSGIGRHVETQSELKIRLAENIRPWRSFKGASHDVVSVAWAPNSMQFGAGAVTHSNPEDLQYNRPCNLLFGDLCNNTIRELPDHRIDRQMPQTGRNVENQDLFNACDPKVYKTVTSIKFHPQGNLMYTASEDETVKIWDLSKPAPQCVRSLRHEASVTSLDISHHHQPAIFATASQKTRNAIRVFGIAGGQETLTVFSSSRAELKPEWKMYPECLAWGPTSHTSHLLLGGFQEYGRELSSENEGHLCLWDANTAQDLKVMPAAQAIHAIVWHPTSPYFASGGAPGFERTDRQKTKTVVRAWDLRHIKRVAFEYECEAREMTDVTFSPIDPNIVTAGCTNSRSYVWDCRWPLQPLHELRHGDSIMPCGERDTGVMMGLWGTGSSLFYTGSSDGSIRAWDIRRHPNDALIHTVAQLEAGIQSGAFSPDGTHLLIGDATGGVHVLSSAPWKPQPSESTRNDIRTKGTPIDIMRAPDGSGAMKVDEENSEREGIKAGQTLLLTGQLVVDPVYGPGKGPCYDGPYAMDVREEKSGNEIGRLKKEVYKQQPFSHEGHLRPEYANPIRILAAARKGLLDEKNEDQNGPDTPKAPGVSVREITKLTPKSKTEMMEAKRLSTSAAARAQDEFDQGNLSNRLTVMNAPEDGLTASMDQCFGKLVEHVRQGADLSPVDGSESRAGLISSDSGSDYLPANNEITGNIEFISLAKHSQVQSQLSPLGTVDEDFIPESEMVEEHGWWPRFGEEEIAKAYARPGVRMG